MSPLPRELIVSGDPTAPNARAFVRSLNVLLKFTRLYGLEHTRSAAQFDSTWVELQQCVQASRENGLLLGASGSQLLLDGEPLESSFAERSFADLLNNAGVASICFTEVRGTRRIRQSGAGVHGNRAESGAARGTPREVFWSEQPIRDSS